MARPRLPIVPQLSPEAIYRRYRACRSGLEKTHWHLLWLLTRPDDPLHPGQAATQVGLTPSWARTILKRWNAQGPDGLADRRAKSNGRKPALAAEQRAELATTLEQRPPDGGLWSGPKLAAYIRRRWGVGLSPQTGWQYLRRLGFTPQVPRPRHPKAATAAEQQAWKRGHGPVDSRASPPASRQAGRGVG